MSLRSDLARDRLMFRPLLFMSLLVMLTVIDDAKAADLVSDCGFFNPGTASKTIIHLPGVGLKLNGVYVVPGSGSWHMCAFDSSGSLVAYADTTWLNNERLRGSHYTSTGTPAFAVIIYDALNDGLGTLDAGTWNIDDGNNVTYWDCDALWSGVLCDMQNQFPVFSSGSYSSLGDIDIQTETEDVPSLSPLSIAMLSALLAIAGIYSVRRNS